MLIFECRNKMVAKSAIAGDLDNICCEWALMTSFIYGALYSKNPEAAAEFKNVTCGLFSGEDGRKVIFDPTIYEDCVADDHSTVYAPFSGAVSREDISPDEMLEALAHLSKIDSLDADAKAEIARELSGIQGAFDFGGINANEGGSDINKVLREDGGKWQ